MGMMPTSPAKASAQSLTRRSLLAAGAGGLVAGAIGMPAPAGAQTSQRGKRRVPFGAALQREHFLADSEYSALFVHHCDLIFPMNDLKWDFLRGERDSFNFDRADLIVDFAADLDRGTHGHAFVWYMALPDWVRDMSDPLEAERVLVDHIEKTAGHYAGRVEAWDVVNEVIAHDPHGDAIWRDGLWHDLLGPRHIDLAFKSAMQADPAAKLGINDYDLEFRGERYDRRRQLVLDLVRRLQDQNLKVDFVGFQGHLYPEVPIDGQATARFIRDLEALGVAYMITELDVIDWKLPIDEDRRDLMAAAHVDDFLDATFSGALPLSVSTWGLSDRYSWISDVMPHRQGAKNRPLPFDADLRPKPMFEIIERYLAA